MSTTQRDALDLNPTNVSTPRGCCPGCQTYLSHMDDLIPADKEGEVYALCCPECFRTLERL